MGNALRYAATLAMWSVLAAAACAADINYPARPVRLIVPFPPGGGADFMGRIIALALSEKRGYAVVVDNRGGAGGAIGSELVAKATPDGYTLVLANNTTHVMIAVLTCSRACPPRCRTCRAAGSGRSRSPGRSAPGCATIDRVVRGTLYVVGNSWFVIRKTT